MGLPVYLCVYNAQVESLKCLTDKLDKRSITNMGFVYANYIQICSNIIKNKSNVFLIRYVQYL